MIRHSPKHTYWQIMCLLLTVLNGCGGPGNSGTSESAVSFDPPILQEASLTVQSVAPPADAAAVARDAQPTVTFSDTLDPASVTSGTAQLLNPIGSSIPVRLGVSGTTISFAPLAGAIPGGTTYKLQLAAGLKSTKGATLGLPFAASFATADQQWQQSPVRIDDPGLSYSFPSISSAPATSYLTADGLGNVIAVWLQTNNTRDAVYASRYSAVDRAWSPPTEVDSQGAPGDAGLPIVAGNATGDAMAIWTRLNGSRSELYANRYRADSGTWDIPVLVDSPSAIGSPQLPNVVMDAAGNAMVAWSQFGVTRSVIYARQFSAAGNAWGAQVQVDDLNATGNALKPVLGADRNGNMVVAWRQAIGQRTVINVSRFDQGSGVWSAPVQVSSQVAAGSADSPVLAVEPSGDVTLAWMQVDARNAIFTSRYTVDDDTWTDPVQTDDVTATGNASNPRLAIDAAGNVTVAWLQKSGGIDVVNVRRYVSRNAGWMPVVQVNQALASGNASNHRVVVDVAGNVMVIWQQVGGGRNAVYGSRYSASSGTWSSPIQLDNASAVLITSAPALIADAAGNLTVAWGLNDRVNPTKIYINRFE